jgi:DNA adenine methylase
MKPILKYPGAKWNLAEWIISHFPDHRHYVEPFFGSGAVFLNKPVAAHEVINDLSGDVVNLFRVVRNNGERLAALIEMTPYARAEYELSSSKSGDPIEDARRFLVRCVMAHGSDLSKSKATGWRTRGVRGMSTGDMITAQLWRYWPQRILDTIDRLRGVEIESRPAVEIISRLSSSYVLIYADPPYPLAERSQKMYQHEMTDADHAELLDALDAHPGPVVLSGYHCALYDGRLKHWHTREKQAQAEKGNTRTEVLWINQVCIDRLGYGPMFDDEHAL